MKRYRVHQSRMVSGSEPDWSAAEVLSDFTLPWEHRAAPKTEFRALWDDAKLHFRFDCADQDLVLGAGNCMEERVLGSDRAEIFLTPDLALNPYYGLEMDPRGEILAYCGRFYRQFDRDWSCDGLEVSAGIGGAAYHVRGSIPLETLRSLNVLKPGAREFFAGVYRAEFSHKPDGSIHQGWMPWVNPHTARPDFHVPASFGVFELQ